MTTWQEIYKELKEQKTFYGIADESQQNADNYFNWLESKYPAIKQSIQDSREKYKEDLA